MRYLVVVEEGPTSFGAHVPDLPGCIAVAETRKAVELDQKFLDVRRNRGTEYLRQKRYESAIRTSPPCSPRMAVKDPVQASLRVMHEREAEAGRERSPVGSCNRTEER